MATYENRVVLILTAAGGIAGIDMFAINFLSPFIAADLGLGNTEIGMIGTVQMIAWSIAAIGTALWSDRHGQRKPFLVVALICFALFSGGSAMAGSLAALLAARFAMGLAEGPVIPIQNAIMLAASSPHRRGLNIGLVQNFGSQLLGALAGPLILIWIATHLGGWRNAFLIAGLPALVMAAVVYFGIHEQSAKRVDKAQPMVPLGQMLREIAGVRNIRLCFLIGALAIGWYATVLTFVPLWAIRTLHFSPAMMSVVMSVIGAAGAVSAVLVPAISDRVGRRTAIAAFSLTGLVLPLALLSGLTALPLLLPAVFVGTLFMGIFPLFIGVVPMESVDADRGATALAIVMGCAQVVGGMVGPLLGGVMADALSLKAPLWMACGLAICTSLVSTLLIETAPARRHDLAGDDQSYSVASNG